MSAVVVDANVWISALFSSEGQHAASRAWLDHWRAAGHQIVVPMTFLVEVGCVLSRKHNLLALATVTVADINVDVMVRPMPVDQSLARIASDIGIAVGLRGADAIYAAVARQEAIPLVTWDTDLLSRASRGKFTAFVPAI